MRAVRRGWIPSSRLGALVALLLAAPNGAPALELGGRRVDVALAFGAMLPGTIQVGWHSDFAPDETFELKSGTRPVVSAIFDVAVLDRLTLGGRINGTSLKIDRAVDLGFYDFDQQVHFLDPGTVRVVEGMLSAKWGIDVTPRVLLRPAVYVGYVKAFASDPDARSKGLGLNAALELQYRPAGPMFLHGEVSLLSQVYGGVSEIGYTRTKGPLLSFAVGAGL